MAVRITWRLLWRYTINPSLISYVASELRTWLDAWSTQEYLITYAYVWVHEPRVEHHWSTASVTLGRSSLSRPANGRMLERTSSQSLQVAMAAVVDSHYIQWRNDVRQSWRHTMYGPCEWWTFDDLAIFHPTLRIRQVPPPSSGLLRPGCRFSAGWVLWQER